MTDDSTESTDCTESSEPQGTLAQAADPTLVLLLTLAQRLEQGQLVWLGTVLKTWTASAFPVGSLLALDSQGQCLGATAPGEELRLMQQALAAPDPSNLPRILETQWQNGQGETPGLPDTGHLILLLEPLKGEQDAKHIRQLAQCLARRLPATRRVLVASGQRELLPRSIPDLLEADRESLVHTLTPVCHMLLLGATQVSRQVGLLALNAGFAVTVCEPRESVARHWQEATLPLQQLPPDQLVALECQDHYCAILALASDPEVDDPGLVAAMNTPAFYVGALGCEQTHRQRKDRLYQMKIPSHWIGTIHAPIGFVIGSRTPAEHAIAILAQVVAERHRRLQRNSRL
ncbi:MAG: hypothetical protein EA349_03230 [Halomonadaceae bacterium]|nr:MAG: hypothetical protein EA349_03230 [Halomonadaceae bacterium]